MPDEASSRWNRRVRCAGGGRTPPRSDLLVFGRHVGPGQRSVERDLDHAHSATTRSIHHGVAHGRLLRQLRLHSRSGGPDVPERRVLDHRVARTGSAGWHHHHEWHGRGHIDVQTSNFIPSDNGTPWTPCVSDSSVSTAPKCTGPAGSGSFKYPGVNEFAASPNDVALDAGGPYLGTTAACDTAVRRRRLRGRGKRHVDGGPRAHRPVVLHRLLSQLHGDCDLDRGALIIRPARSTRVRVGVVIWGCVLALRLLCRGRRSKPGHRGGCRRRADCVVAARPGRCGLRASVSLCGEHRI